MIPYTKVPVDKVLDDLYMKSLDFSPCIRQDIWLQIPPHRSDTAGADGIQGTVTSQLSPLIRRRNTTTKYNDEIRLSQAAACDGLVCSVNYNEQNSGTQGYALPLFED